jgi:hypothetical protein
VVAVTVAGPPADQRHTLCEPGTERPWRTCAGPSFAFRDTRSRRSRRATERELLILRSHLEASLLDDEVPIGALAAARSAHEDLLTRHRVQPGPERPGDPDRTAALRDRPGWAWTRVVRSYDDYDRLLARLEDEQRPAPPRRPSRR